MIELKNEIGQILLRLEGGQIKNIQGQTIGSTRGNALLNLQGQVLAEVTEGCVYSVSKELLLETRGNEILNLKGQRLATVDGGEQLERGLLAAAFLLFC